MSQVKPWREIGVTSILIETIYRTLKAMDDSKLLDIDITQVTVAK